MKITILCLAVLALSCVDVKSDDHMEELHQICEGCRKENGVSDEDFMKYKDSQQKVDEVPENVKCSLNCFYVKAGFMNDAGKFNAEAFKVVFAGIIGEKVDEALTKCKDLEGANPCDTAYIIHQCIMPYNMGKLN